MQVAVVSKCQKVHVNRAKGDDDERPLRTWHLNTLSLSWHHQLGTLNFEACICMPRNAFLNSHDAFGSNDKRFFVMCVFGRRALTSFPRKTHRTSLRVLTTKSKRFTSPRSELCRSRNHQIAKMPFLLQLCLRIQVSVSLFFFLVMRLAKTLQFLSGTAPFVYETTALWIILCLRFFLNI
jgi:hypothetical protein